MRVAAAFVACIVLVCLLPRSTLAATCLLSGAQPIPIPADTGSFGPCPPGFYCPNATAASTKLYICPPTDDCLNQRLHDETFCDVQGDSDVAVCAGGFYCPEFNKRFVCPEGYYCPVGSTEPHKCSAMSSCPTGSYREVFYGQLFAIGLVFMFVACILFFVSKTVAKFPAQSRTDAVAPISPQSRTPAAGGVFPFAASPHPGSPNLSSAFSQHTDSMKAIGRAIKKRRAGGSANGVSIAFRDVAVTVEVKAQHHEEKKPQASDNAPDAKEQNGDNNKEEMKAVSSPAVVAGANEKPNTNNVSAEAKPPAAAKVKPILQKVSGVIEPGKLTAIMGPSGAGKTVLMTRLLGRTEPGWTTSGKVNIISSPEQLEQLNQNKNDATDDNNNNNNNNNNNDSSDNRDEFKRLVALVPQDDVLHYELSVHANVFFSSEVRLPGSWSQQEKTEFRHAVLDGLQLLPYAERVVGAPAELDESGKGGLSGGQRKRCSVAVELAAAPSALFLDEPTTGLDASIAYKLCQLLRQLAHEADIPVVLVIHQPRVEVWEMIDNLILLAPGGKVAFQGPRSDVLDFLKNTAGVIDSVVGGNPADVAIDAISEHPEEIVSAWAKHAATWKQQIAKSKAGKQLVFKNKDDQDSESDEDEKKPASKKQKKPKSQFKNNEASLSIEDCDDGPNLALTRKDTATFAESERKRADPPKSTDVKNEKGTAQSATVVNAAPAEIKTTETKTETTAETTTVAAVTKPTETSNHEDDRISLVAESWLMLQRRLLKFSNDWKVLIIDVIVTVVCAAIVSAGVTDAKWGAPIRGDYVLLTVKYQNELILMYTMLCCIGCSACIGPSAVRAFGVEKSQLLREFRSGYRVTAVFIGYSFVELIRVMILCLCFTTVGYLMWRPVMQFGTLYSVMLIIFWCGDFVGSIVGIFVPISVSRLISLLTCVFLGLINGFADVPGIYYAAYSYHATIVLQAAEIEPSKTVWDFGSVTKVFDAYPKTPLDQVPTGVGIMVLELVVLKALGFLSLWFVAQ